MFIEAMAILIEYQNKIAGQLENILCVGIKGNKLTIIQAIINTDSNLLFLLCFIEFFVAVKTQ